MRLKPVTTFLTALGLSRLYDLFTKAVPKYPINIRKGKTIRGGKSLPELPSPRGKKIDCLSGRGCGNKVSESVGICRSCRRAGKLKAARIASKMRKAAKE